MQQLWRALAVEIIISASLFSAAFNCGQGLSCQWIDDTPTRGTFILSHAGAVTQTLDPLANLNHTFVSPSGFWQVVIDSLNQYDTTDSRIPPLDEVAIKGFMQHLMRPPGPEHATDPAIGDKFNFDLDVFEFAGLEDTSNGVKNHGHNDGYLADLLGAEKPPAAGLSSYNFGVKGEHTEFFFTPPEVPEPVTAVLFAGGFLLLCIFGLDLSPLIVLRVSFRRFTARACRNSS